MNIIINECVFRDVYLNMSLWMKRGEKTNLFYFSFCCLVLMFPGNSNFDKRDLSKPNGITKE